MDWYRVPNVAKPVNGKYAMQVYGMAFPKPYKPAMPLT